MLATYMRRMRHNKMEIRIAGSSCRPQKKKKKIQNVLEFVNLSESICTGSRLFGNSNLLTAHEHVANSYIVPSLYIYFLSLY